jgi:hypothetical protein
MANIISMNFPPREEQGSLREKTTKVVGTKLSRYAIWASILHQVILTLKFVSCKHIISTPRILL